ncbi:MAG: imidazole glycerol phosphate synthase subunit HisH, partial [Actinomycetota bacterium]
RAMKTIRSSEIDKAIGEALHSNEAKLLGICLGMQLLGKSSTEDGFSDGLGLVDNEVKKITSVSDQQVKIPNIGFREVQADEEMKIFGGLETRSRF